jgi:hypothetical protein
MVPVWTSEWERVIIEKKYWERAKNSWGDNGAMDWEEEDAYDKDDFAHLMIYNADSGTHVLTIHPEMGLTHVHTQLEYPTGGLSEEGRTKFTGYFMVLTPEGGDEELEEEHAIEALRVTWGNDIAPTVDALVRNPKLRYKDSKLGTRLAYTATKGHRIYRHQL